MRVGFFRSLREAVDYELECRQGAVRENVFRCASQDATTDAWAIAAAGAGRWIGECKSKVNDPAE
jgi:hypothetical protein